MEKDYLDVPIKCCPFCGQLPQFQLPVWDDRTPWDWYIYCENKSCPVQPRGRSKFIRKKHQANKNILMKKIIFLALKWNAMVCTNILQARRVSFDNLKKE